VIAAVMTTPHRQQYLPALLRILTPSVETTIVCTHLPSVGTFLEQACRTWDTALRMAKPKEPVLICTDDVIAPRDWRERWEKMHAEACATRYALFTRQLTLMKPDNLDRGWVLTSHGNSFYDPAVVMIDQPDWIARVMAWFNSPEGDVVKDWRRDHHDKIFQAYINARHLSYVVATPSLFEHVGEVSNPNLKHKIGRSALYVGDSA
jgi:hypothetical protein